MDDNDKRTNLLGNYKLQGLSFTAQALGLTSSILSYSINVQWNLPKYKHDLNTLMKP